MRIAAHIHSSHSYDGKLDLPSLKLLASDYSIDSMLISEHSNGHSSETGQKAIDEVVSLSNDSLQLIPGFEVPYGGAHVLCFGVQKYPEGIDGTSEKDDVGKKLITAFADQGAIIILAHPHKYGFSYIDEWLEGILHGVEVWNGQYDSKRVPRTRAVRFYAEKENKKNPWLAFAGLDFHRSEHIGGPLLQLRERITGHKEIISELKSGNYHIVRPDGKIMFDSESICLRGNVYGIILQSKIYSFVTGIAKRFLAFSNALGIKIPRKWKEKVRQWI